MTETMFELLVFGSMALLVLVAAMMPNQTLLRLIHAVEPYAYVAGGALLLVFLCGLAVGEPMTAW